MPLFLRFGAETGAFLQEVCKPGSVFVWSSLYETGCPASLAAFPESRRATSAPPSGLASDGVYQASMSPYCRCALTAPFHRYRRGGCIISVALSVEFPRPDVIRHRAL